MSALPEPSVPDERLDLLDAVIYGDVFDCAVTLDELWRYGRVRIDRETLWHRLRDDASLSSVLVEREGLYALRDRPTLLDRRPARMKRAHVLQRRARRLAKIFRQVPFVRGLALTGSAAAADAGNEADVDLLVIVEPGRLGTVFLLLGSASRLLGRQLFCPNYYVRADRLDVPPSSLYVARELNQARILVGGGALRNANPWLEDVFPNALHATPTESDLRAGSPLQNVLEAPFRGRFGDGVEQWARRVAAARLRAHYRSFGHDVPADVTRSFEAGVALRFHARSVVEPALERYKERRAQLAARLEEVDRERVAAGTGSS